MCFFNKKGNAVRETVTYEKPTPTPVQSDPNSRYFTFNSIPANLQELQSLPEIAMDDPFKTAALALCALCVYGKDRENGKEMLNFLRGPQPPLSPMQLSFLNDRFMDGQFYVPYSYFEGAKPENDYNPNVPFRVNIFAVPNSFQDEGYANLYLRSGGADSPRSIKLRRANGKWYLWEQFVLVGIREPKSKNPWG